MTGTASLGRRILPKLLMLLASITMTLAGLEAAVRILRPAPPDTPPAGPPLFVPCGDCPFLYRLNPDHPEISTQGLRDRDYEIPKPPQVVRLLILGDSVTYGMHVDADETFPKILERRLDGARGRVEVINAGVNGYTPYNELEYFNAEGRSFQPDIVVVAFCMNDVVDPELHWKWDVRARPGQFTTNLTLSSIPDEAIPDLRYHREHVIPRLASLRKWAQSPLNRSRLYTLASRRLEALMQSRALPKDERGRPLHIAGEDTLSIQVMLDRNTPQMQWLKGIYEHLADAVHSEGAALIAVIVPLSYQLDPDYPYTPQAQLVRLFEEGGIPSLDVLPAFRKHAGADLFLGKRSGFDDVWHLSEEGHRLVADQLEQFLVERGLLGSR